jgi:hypothetical protein
VRAPLSTTDRRHYLHCLVLGAIIFATLLAAWPGSRSLFQGDFAESVQSVSQLPHPGYLSTTAAIQPMEAVAASLTPDEPEPASQEAPSPAIVAAVEPQADDAPSSQTPSEPQPPPEPIVAAYAVQPDDLPAQGAADQGQPTPLVESQPEPAPTAAPTDAPAPRVTAIGDSVMLAAAGNLAAAILNIEIDAEVGRPVPTAIDILRARRNSGRLGEVVVMHIGNNSPFTADEFDQMMGLMADVTRVVFVNLTVPRGWEGPNNAVLAAGVARYPNAVLVDWHSASVDRPQFLNDGVHLRPEGALAYAQLIAASLGAH